MTKYLKNISTNYFLIKKNEVISLPKIFLYSTMKYKNSKRFFFGKEILDNSIKLTIAVESFF